MLGSQPVRIIQAHFPPSDDVVVAVDVALDSFLDDFIVILNEMRMTTKGGPQLELLAPSFKKSGRITIQRRLAPVSDAPFKVARELIIKKVCKAINHG